MHHDGEHGYQACAWKEYKYVILANLLLGPEEEVVEVKDLISDKEVVTMEIHEVPGHAQAASLT